MECSVERVSRNVSGDRVSLVAKVETTTLEKFFWRDLDIPKTFSENQNSANPENLFTSHYFLNDIDMFFVPLLLLLSFTREKIREIDRVKELVFL